MARATSAKIAAERAEAVDRRSTGESPEKTMSALPSGTGVAARLAPAKTKTRGFLHIVRHGAGPNAIYIVTYHRLNHEGPSGSQRLEGHPKPLLAEGARALIELLE